MYTSTPLVVCGYAGSGGGISGAGEPKSGVLPFTPGIYGKSWTYSLLDVESESNVRSFWAIHCDQGGVRPQPRGRVPVLKGRKGRSTMERAFRKEPHGLQPPVEERLSKSPHEMTSDLRTHGGHWKRGSEVRAYILGCSKKLLLISLARVI